MNSLFEKEDFKFEDIESLITNQIEESIHLDFKSGESLSKTPLKKKEISKDVAAFANSDGGIIIYGLLEKNHVADSFSFIDGNDFTKEWLEQIINTTISRRIEGLTIYPIRKNNDISKSIYLVKIPRSTDSPHISQDKRFYKRFNFESVMMEEYEIRQSYGRKVKSELALDKWAISEINNNDDYAYKFQCTVSVINLGDISEKNYKVNVIFENYDNRAKIAWPRTSTNIDYTILEKGRVKLSAESKSSIFPNEIITVIRFDLEVSKIDCLEVLSATEIKIYLYYENGEDVMEANFKGIVEKIENNYL
ncbi:ATP-binding protein [Flavobacteriaceae bacterium XHP0103]|uniref:AlbA family DNA-binding domain-containing protein n=1 Tax=Marixanthotalea marina TaxID=2844359 RepID=UPI002989DF64|nr:ATP-binding protein [Marixanthotalea marina]MBU3821676.1 ATP-binding protein [Marixanthotalea marina]